MARHARGGEKDRGEATHRVRPPPKESAMMSKERQGHSGARQRYST